MTRRHTSRDDGYTLLEMLVALVVFGLIMAGLAQSYRFGLTAWSDSTRATAAPENMAAVDAALTQMIAQSLPGSMTGDGAQLAFTTSLPPGAGLPAGLADVALTLTPSGTFMLRYRLHPPGVPLAPLPAAKTEPLLQGVSALTLSYYTPPANGTPGWSSSWSGEGLPALVKIHIAFAQGPDWPDLVAAPVHTSH